MLRPTYAVPPRCRYFDYYYAIRLPPAPARLLMIFIISAMPSHISLMLTLMIIYADCRTPCRFRSDDALRHAAVMPLFA